MLKVKENFFDRFDQSIKLLKGNFTKLFTILFLYNLFALVVFKITLGNFMLSRFILIEDFSFLTLISNPNVILLILLGTIVFLLYVLFYIVIYLSILFSIKKSIENENVSMKEVLTYGKSRFLNSFKTYWYVFEYVYLLPSILLIIGLLFLLFGLEFNENILGIGAVLIIPIILFGLVFIIYKGNKSTFALFSAVEKNDFSKSDFVESVKITKGKWWRIFGNVFLIGFIVSTVCSIINSIISAIFFFGSGGAGIISESLTSITNSGNTDDIGNILEQYMNNKSIFIDFLKDSVSLIVDSIGSLLIIIFIYIFFLRLYREYNYNNPKELIIENNNIDKNIEL